MMIKLSKEVECNTCHELLPEGDWVHAFGHQGYKCIECKNKEDKCSTS